MTIEPEQPRPYADQFSAPPAGTAAPVTPGLPIPSLTRNVARTDARLVVTTVDRDGRLADRSPVTYLGWSAGEAILFHVGSGPVVIVRRGDGVPVTRRGHLRLPVAVRRRSGIAVGDRVLVVAHRRPSELLVVSAATVEALVTARLQRDGQTGP